MTGKLASILADKTAGATEIARRALEYLASAGPEDLAGAARLLKTARPDFAVLVNLGRRLETFARTGPPAPEAFQRMLAELESAARSAAENAARLLPPAADLITASYSSQVVQTVRLYRGRDAGRVWVWAPDPADPISRQAAAVLQAELTGSLGGLIQPLGLIGADAVFADGSVINGTPSLSLAEALAGRGAPLYVVASSWKLLSEPPRPPLEPGFDLVPARLITEIIVESGPWKPGSA
jgi:translation initiation factor 2B subunit (eIF-2B alpha/beta/delta family)